MHAGYRSEFNSLHIIDDIWIWWYCKYML